jgi:YesN/AraC family two-component response regulator
MDHFQLDLTYSCKLIYESIQLPVFVTQDGHTVEGIWGDRFQESPFLSEPETLVRLLVEKEMKYPVILSTNYLEEFIILPAKSNGEHHRFIVIGPCIHQTPTNELIVNLLNDNQITYQNHTSLRAYWSNLPLVNRTRLLHIAALAHWTVNQEALEITDVQQYSYQHTLPNMFKNNVEMAVSTQRELSIFHQSMEIENRLIEIIRTGNKSELMNLWIQVPREDVAILSKRSQLRSIKNLAICSVAIAMRAAIAGGLNAELACTLCDQYIQQIEELDHVKTIEAAVVHMLFDYTERVEQIQKESVSRPIRLCQEYIFNHLYQELTVDKLSEWSGLNGNYLMNLFKEQTGITLMNYIQKHRVDEAKKLLHLTSDTISSIGLRLNFYDQAHFIKVFKKYTGMTPKKYRSELIKEG